MTANTDTPAAAPPVRSEDQERSLAVFRAAVKKTFAFLKSTTEADDLFAKSLRLDDGAGYLLPVCELHAGDAETIRMLAAWREQNAFAFPSQFKVTEEGTKQWLRSKLLDVEDRLLFLVTDRLGRPIGHLGYANAVNPEGELEVDNVIRGKKDALPGVMTRATTALLRWAEEVLGPTRIFLRVWDDNEHAIKFYRQLGFTEGPRIQMTRRSDGSSVVWEPSPSGERAFLRMNYEPRRRFDGSRMILTAGPSVSAREVSYALDAARYGWNTQWSKYLTRFERTVADYIGVKYAIATSSCTGALHIALAGLGIGPGDEVIVPNLTWVATANAVLYVGATPRFADISADTWCMDERAIEALITPRTKAIIAVHLYGHPARIDAIRAIADAHGIRLIEDAAPSAGAECAGQRVGTLGDFAAFSFQGAKVAVTGEGGMLVTNNEELYRQAYKIWDQGRVPGTFWIDSNGLKYKMSNLQAAFGTAQIERIDELVEAKRRVFGWYARGLEGVPHVRLMSEAPWARSIYWMTNILLEDGARVSRDGLREELKKRNIDTRAVFPPMSSYPIFGNVNVDTPVTDHIGARGINLPSGVCLKQEEVEYVCDNIRSVLS